MKGHAMHVSVTVDNKKAYVSYNCPSCNFRNRHRYFGPETHYCAACDEPATVRALVPAEQLVSVG